MRTIYLYLIVFFIFYGNLHASDMREDIALQVLSGATSIDIEPVILNTNHPIPNKSLSSTILSSKIFDSILHDIETNGPDRLARATLIRIKNTWSKIEKSLNTVVILAATGATIINSINLSEDCANPALLISGTTLIIVFPVAGIIKQTIAFALNYREQQLSYVQKEIEKTNLRTQQPVSVDLDINNQITLDNRTKTIHLVKASLYTWYFFQSLSQTLAFLTNTAEAVIIGFDDHSPCENRTQTKIGIALSAASVVIGSLNWGINYMCQKRQQQLQKL